MPPTYFFMIDVSMQSMKEGAIGLFGSIVRDIINENMMGDRTMVLCGYL